jgi:hypothetical protein
MMFDPRKKAIDELMSHLDKSDDDDLSSAMKPKGVEVTKVGVMGGDDDESQSPGIMDQDKDVGDGTTETDSMGGPKLSDEEIQELIEALQSKLG